MKKQISFHSTVTGGEDALQPNSKAFDVFNRPQWPNFNKAPLAESKRMQDEVHKFKGHFSKRSQTNTDRIGVSLWAQSTGVKIADGREVCRAVYLDPKTYKRIDKDAWAAASKKSVYDCLWGDEPCIEFHMPSLRPFRHEEAELSPGTIVPTFG